MPVLTITQQPVSEIISAGSNTTFSLTVRSDESYDWHWEAKESASGVWGTADEGTVLPSGSFTYQSEDLSPGIINLSVPATAARNGHIYRCVLEGSETVTSAEAVLTVGILIDGELIEIPSWANGTDAQIAGVLDAAENGDVDLQEDVGWAVGDIRKIPLKGIEGSSSVYDIDLVISSFDEYIECGNLLQVDFANTTKLREFFIRNYQNDPDNFEDNDYASSYARYLYIDDGPGTSGRKIADSGRIFNGLPAWLRHRLETFDVHYSKVADNETVVRTLIGNRLSLRSQKEVFGTGPSEGAQIAYYQIPANRIKKPAEGDTAAGWWLRTPNGTDEYYYVDASGNLASTPTTLVSHLDVGSAQSQHFAPFGCLGGYDGPNLSKVKIDEEHFPDNTLRTLISTYDADGDGYLNGVEIESIERISNIHVTSLKGIEYLPFLKYLNAYGADNGGLQDETLDFSNNASLETLSIGGSAWRLHKVIFNNANLRSISITGALTQVLFLSAHTKLTSIIVRSSSSNVEIPFEMDISQLTNLQNLQVYRAICKSLDIRNIPRLLLAYNAALTQNTPKLTKYTIYGDDNYYISCEVSFKAGNNPIAADNGEDHTYTLIYDQYANIITDGLRITTDAEDVSVYEGEGATFRCAAASSHTLQYEWEYRNYFYNVLSTYVKDWSHIGTGQDLTVSASAYLEYHRFRCKVYDPNSMRKYDVYDANGNYVRSENRYHIYNYSSIVHLKVFYPVKITKQPASEANIAGGTTVFTVEASNDPPDVLIPSELGGASSSYIPDRTQKEITYQWQSKGVNDDDYTDISGETTSALCVNASAENVGIVYRCVVSDGVYDLITDSARVILVQVLDGSPAIITQPESLTLTEGETGSFIVDAFGDDLAYQWQISDDAETWNDIRGAVSSSYETTANLSMNGNYFRCVVSNTHGSVASNSAILYVMRLLPPTIVSHPKSVISPVGRLVSFSVTATGGALEYQWQVSVDGGQTWLAYMADVNNEHRIIANYDTNGYRFRCRVFNNAGEEYSDVAVLSVSEEITNVVYGCSILLQPSDMIVLDGRTTGLRIVADFDSTYGDGSYQVQKKTRDSSEWRDIPNAVEPDYSFNAVSSMDGTQYRYKLTNESGTGYSNVVTLTVLEDPVILQHPANTTAYLNGVAAFDVTSNAEKADFNWQVRKAGDDQWQNIDDVLPAVNGKAHLEFIAENRLADCEIRCLVGNQLVTYTSNTATLTILNEESDQGIPINEYFFPDALFRSVVSENYDTNENGYLSKSEIDAVTEMIIDEENGGGIEDLRGIQHFTALNSLRIQDTRIQSLSLGNLGLTELIVTGNERLSEINIGGCTQLRTLYCGDNNLDTLDLHNNEGIEALFCQNNKITALDLYPLSELQFLDCHGNHIQEINVGSCDLASYVEEHEPDIDDENGIITYGSIDGEAYLCCDRGTIVKYDYPIEIITHPASVNALIGTEVLFSVEADGEYLQYQWQKREAEGVWTAIADEMDSTLSIEASSDADNTEYRACVYNACHTVYSDIAALRTYSYPVITTQPQDVVTIAGREITFVIESDSNEDGYLWQALGSEDEEWVNADRVFDTVSDVPILRITSELRMSGYKLRCVVSNPVAETVSDEVSLLVLGDPRIITQPESAEVVFGTKHHFTVEAAGEMLSYQWMEKSQYDAIWENCVREGATTPTLIVLSEAGADLKQFRCVVTNGFQTITSNTVTLTMITLPVITSNPHSVSAIEESSVSFAVSVTGRSMTFRWQIREDANAEWRDYDGDDSANYRIRFNASIEMNGFLYRCIISNIAGTVYSDEAELVISSSLFMLADAFDESAENILPAGEYTFSLNASKEGVTYSLGFGIYGDTTWLVENETKPFTFYADGIRPIRIILAAQRSDSVSGCTIKPMLESGDTAHAWVSPAQKVHDIVNDFNYGWLSIGNTYNNVENVITATLPCDVTIKYRPIWKDTI